MKSSRTCLYSHPSCWWVSLYLSLAMALCAAFFPQTMTAHGIGTPHLVNAPMGPYAIWAYTDPNPLRVGEMHVTVGVAERQTMTMLDNVPIRVVLAPLMGDSPPITVSATNTDSINRFLYTAVLAPPRDGQWRVTIQLTGISGVGSIAFTTSVLPSQFVTWGTLLRLSLALLGASWFIWTWWHWQPPTRRHSLSTTPPLFSGEDANLNKPMKAGQAPMPTPTTQEQQASGE